MSGQDAAARPQPNGEPVELVALVATWLAAYALVYVAAAAGPAADGVPGTGNSYVLVAGLRALCALGSGAIVAVCSLQARGELGKLKASLASTASVGAGMAGMTWATILVAARAGLRNGFQAGAAEPLMLWAIVSQFGPAPGRVSLSPAVIITSLGSALISWSADTTVDIVYVGICSTTAFGVMLTQIKTATEHGTEPLHTLLAGSFLFSSAYMTLATLGMAAFQGRAAWTKAQHIMLHEAPLLLSATVLVFHALTFVCMQRLGAMTTLILKSGSVAVGMLLVSTLMGSALDLHRVVGLFAVVVGCTSHLCIDKRQRALAYTVFCTCLLLVVVAHAGHEPFTVQDGPGGLQRPPSSPVSSSLTDFPEKQSVMTDFPEKQSVMTDFPEKQAVMTDFPEKQSVMLVVAIGTGPKNRALRDTIRETWGKWLKEANVPTFFFTDGGNTVASAEASEVDDLVLQDIGGGYSNFMARFAYQAKWLSERYSFKYFMRLDDDGFLCVPQFMQELNRMPRERLFYGKYWCQVGYRRADENLMLMSADVIDFLLQAMPMFRQNVKSTFAMHFGVWLHFLDISVIDDQDRLDSQVNGERTKYMHLRDANLDSFPSNATFGDFCTKFLWAHHVHSNEVLRRVFYNTDVSVPPFKGSEDLHVNRICGGRHIAPGQPVLAPRRTSMGPTFPDLIATAEYSFATQFRTPP